MCSYNLTHTVVVMDCIADIRSVGGDHQEASVAPAGRMVIATRPLIEFVLELLSRLLVCAATVCIARFNDGLVRVCVTDCVCVCVTVCVCVFVVVVAADGTGGGCIMASLL